MPAQQQNQQSFNIRDFLTIFFKHKYKILITFLVIAGATCVIGFLYTPKQFVARAVVMVKFGREFVQTSEVGNAQLPNLNQEAIINTEIQILTGRELISRVVNAIGEEELYPELGKISGPPDTRREIALLNFRQNVFVNPVKGSNLIEVYFRNDNPVLAAKATNALVEYLKDKHLQVFSDSKSSFLEAQLKEYEEKLKKSETSIGSFKQRHQVFSLDEQRTSLLSERAQVESLLKSEQIRIKELQHKIDFLKDRKNVFSDGVVEELRSKLNALEQKEQELMEKYNDGSQIIISHRKEMRTVREQLQKNEQQVRSAEITKLQADFEPLQVKVAGLQRRYSEIDANLRQIDGRSRELQDLKREAAANENNYQTYLKKSEEARISEDLDRRKMTNVNVIEAASVPITPAKGNKQKVFGIGFFLSIALSLGLAYAAEFLPHCMTTPHIAQSKLGLPVLVTISRKADW
jgi:polysaccharide biosynthesis protein PslE